MNETRPWNEGAASHSSGSCGGGSMLKATLTRCGRSLGRGSQHAYTPTPSAALLPTSAMYL